MTSVESPEGQCPPRAGFPLGCTGSMLQGQDFDFGKFIFFVVFVFCFACHICVVSVLLSSLHPASYAFYSSIDVMEIVTKLGFLELHYSGPSARPQACSESHACGSSKDLYRGLFVVSSTRSSRWLAHLIHSTFEFLRGYPRLCALQPNCSLELFSNTHHGVWFLVFSSSRTAPCRWNWCGTRE